MAARKDPEDRVRRNKPTTAQTDLPTWDGVYRGFALKARNANIKWHNDTLIWWDKWRKSPQAMFTTDLDWESLYVAAQIHQRIMEGCSHTAMAALTGELRKREGMFGASMEDRQRLNITNGGEAQEVATEATVAKAASAAVDYLTRVNKKVAEAQENKHSPGG